MTKPSSTAIDEPAIARTLQESRCPSASHVRDILAKAREARGLALHEVAALQQISDPELLGELFAAAAQVKEAIYGNRLVLFAPLYISNLCANECSYCAFRNKNDGVVRRSLTQAEVAAETKALVEQGHKRLLLVAGESTSGGSVDFLLQSIETIYATRSGPGEVRRVNVNVAPLTTEEYARFKEARIGTYQLFQETYHRETYRKVHLRGRKADYDWRVTCMDRALEAGLHDVGIGVLFGLFDWRFEILALLQHIQHLEAAFGVGPHTISVPRLEPATGSEVASHPPHAVDDLDFRRIVAILRLAVPYTGIIMSTRENARIRQESFALGVSQISAGSRTNPGGYTDGEAENESQFSLGDHRSLEEVIRDISSLGYVPSFCTGCYRLGRVGADFMDLAKPGEIKDHCGPNALTTFLEYLLDYAGPETKAGGEAVLARSLARMDDALRARTEKMLGLVRGGKRDIYC